MMKLLFGFLLLLSIVLFVLMQWGGALTGADNNGQPLAALNPEKIILLDKPEARRLPGSAVPAVQSVVAASTPVTLAPTVAGASAPAASAPLPASVPAKAAVSAPSAPVATATLPRPAPAKAVVSPPPAAPLPVPATARVPAPAVKAAASTCMEWGEFSGTDLTRTTQSLSTLNLGDRLAQRTVEYASGYWVYIPPLKNKAAVSRKIAQIKALGVEDYYVVHEPPKMVNVISLGVFKTREAAKKFLASLQKKGVRTAKMGERKRRLKFVAFEFRNIDAGTTARLSKLQKDFPYSELKAVPCNNKSR